MRRRLAPLAVLAVGLAACRQDMHDQPKYKPLAASDFFADGQAARPLVEDTVPRGGLRGDALLHTGKQGADFADLFPFTVDLAVLQRGRERYEVYCTPCHGRAGYGDGMVVLRGFRSRPASFHEQRLRDKPAGYFFDVITSGFGAMLDYSAQLTVRDRWAVVAYLRALQLSQNAPPELVPPDERARLAQEVRR